jgi:antitoxin component of MazEF toxin-antitoxin module
VIDLMQVKLQKIGNSFMVTIPKRLSEQAKLKIGEMLNISLERGNLIIKPMIKKNLVDFSGVFSIPDFDTDKITQEIKEGGNARDRIL